MKGKTVGIVLFFSLFFLSSPSEGETHQIDKEITFVRSDLEVIKEKGFDKVSLRGCDLSSRVGEPQLPVRLLHIALPSGETVRGFRVKSFKRVKIKGSFYLYPVQPPRLLSAPSGKDEPIEFVAPKESIYRSDSPYPVEVVKLLHIGDMGGVKIASFLVYPVQYFPFQRELLFYSSIKISIELTSIPGEPRPKAQVNPLMGRLVKKLVSNPEDITLRKVIGEGVKSSFLPPGDYQYLIITEDSYAPYFKPLADWKTKKGIPAVIVTTDSIYANCSGHDYQEKIRNCIKDTHQDWGVTWVLLGGDTGVVPARMAFAMDCETGNPADNDIPCDLYYSDLDRTWDLNGNHIYGEVEDSVDMLPDVFVGRASVSSHQEAQAWVNKVLTYEKNPPSDYTLNMLFLGEILWYDPYTDAGVGKDMIDDWFVPPRFDPITKLYQSQGNENRSSVIAAMDEGQNIINHDGHAWYTVMGVGDGSLRISDMDSLSNGPRYSILYSIGCWPAAFDYDCIAEHFITNPNGGGVAFIGNSRYGWGSPGNPGYGYSDRFDNQFYRFLFQEDIHHIGATLALHKVFYVPRSQQENVYRWCEYEINLLGDPEMPIWTDRLRSMEVSCPQQVSIGENTFRVTCSYRDEPIDGALVCLTNDQDVYTYGECDERGEIGLNFTTQSTSPIKITATAHNYLPFEDIIEVATEGPQVRVWRCSFLEGPGGNWDGEINTGEEALVNLSLRNQGGERADSVQAFLTTSDSLIFISDSIEEYGTIGPGDTTVWKQAFAFSLSPQAENGHAVFFDLGIEDSSGNQWMETICLRVATPVLLYSGFSIDDDLGNGNGIAEPGESLQVVIGLKNIGLSPARDVWLTLTSQDRFIHILDSLGLVGEIPPDSVAEISLKIKIDPTTPTPHLSLLGLEAGCEGICPTQDCLVLPIGRMEFEDDMEGGSENWLHAGEGDLWHISERRSHSGSHSWYCGEDSSGLYRNSMDCFLELPTLTLPPQAHLSFWLWYETTNYGVDGIYVEANDGQGWEVLDFIGSGGALDSSLNIGNPWLENSYDLSSFPTGKPIRIRFRFVSDNQDFAEGFYLDDVRLFSDLSHPDRRVALSGYRIDDDRVGGSSGNGNGFIDPGEVIELPVSITNIGGSLASGLRAFLRTRDSLITVVDSLVSFPDLFPNGSAQSLEAFLFEVSETVPPDHPFYFSLTIEDSKGEVWNRTLMLRSIQPKFSIVSFSISDQRGGDGDNIPEPGEVCDLWVKVRNSGGRDGLNIWAKLKSGNPEAEVRDSVAIFPDIPADSSGENLMPFSLKLGEEPSEISIPLFLSLYEGQGYYRSSLSLRVALKWGRMLLVEDDGEEENSESYTEVLDSLGAIYDCWDIQEQGIMDGALLANYPGVIWFTGGQAVNTLSGVERDLLQGYLDNGGKLFLTGRYILHEISNTSFCSGYLQADSLTFFTRSYHLEGVSGNPVTDGLQVDLDPQSQPFSGVISPLSPAFPVFEYKELKADSALYGALAIDGSYKLVFLSFGFEGIYPFTKREETMQAVWLWLWGITHTPIQPEELVPTAFNLAQNYPNPFNPETKFEYSLPFGCEVKLEIYNILGQKVATLADGPQGPGYKTLIWDGKGEDGQRLSSGIYLYRLKAGNFVSTKKAVILR